jgi:hypothetical protein
MMAHGTPPTDRCEIGLVAEAARQQDLLRAIAQPSGALPSALRALPGPQRDADAEEGLNAYRRNAQAHAHRALSAAYPTVLALLGDEALAALARDLWRDSPPLRGDLACFGAELPPWLDGLPAYADLPWLGDVARLDWAVHEAGRAADANSGIRGLERLGDTDPDALRLAFVPGSACVRSAWPIEAIWRAHQIDEAERDAALSDAKAALAAGRQDAVWIHRQGWRVQVTRLADPPDALFALALLQGQSLGQALARHGEGLSFALWLQRALGEGWLSAVEPLSARPAAGGVAAGE